MSGIAVVYGNSNTPADPGVLERVMGRLAHRGPDGRGVLVSGHAALGHCHFWTTPEETGERQPLQLPGMPFTIVFDGRLDNRPELFTSLGIDAGQAAHISDAALVLYAYARWSEHCFEHFVGEFGLVILDEQEDKLVCARDPLGDRTLFYATRGDRWVVASEPWAVAGADGLKPALNERAVAHYFALRATEDGQTFFEGVFELLPAHVMIIDASGERKWRYWQPNLTRKIRCKTDEDYAEHFRTLLEESIRCRMRSTTPIAVLMSGGLDSTSIASLAARMIAPQQLTTISYVFDEFPECDEREYINAVKEKYNLRSIQIPCDDLWPLKDWENWPRNPNQPEGNPYRLLKERAYRQVQLEGIRVLFTGAFGDHLYSGAQDWLADMLFDGFLLDGMSELAWFLRHAGFRWTWRQGYFQRVVRRLLDAIPGGKNIHRKQTALAWLSSHSRGSLDNRKSLFSYGLQSNLFGLEASKGVTGEIINTNRYVLELRDPYRDRRLIEFVLALPAYQLYYRGYYKRVLRNAMWKILPEPIRIQGRVGSLFPFFVHGLELEKNVLENCLQNIEAGWQKYVSVEWVFKNWEDIFRPPQDGAQALFPWLCVSFDAWNNLSNIQK